ncbi:MAG: hypothetical protein ACRYFX_18605 [Janthinobacterium lividum]
MAKQPPPTTYAGNYLDRLGKRYVVPRKADFQLYPAGSDWQPLTDLPHQTDAEHFRKALDFGTFQLQP